MQKTRVRQENYVIELIKKPILKIGFFIGYSVMKISFQFNTLAYARYLMS